MWLASRVESLATPFVRGAVLWIALVTVGAYLAYRAIALVATGHVEALWLKDYTLYVVATDRWLDGNGFYPVWQLARPWNLEWGAILYPPISLVLLVPFALIDPTVSAFLWITVPAAITALVIASWRPTTTGWVAILALLSIHPLSLLNWTAGTPTTWFVAIVALGTRWPWVSAAMLIKPTLAPFALLGIKDRRWWLVAGALGIGSLALGPMTSQWIEMMSQVRGADATVLYSLANVPTLFVPIAARRWSGRRAERDSGCGET